MARKSKRSLPKDRQDTLRRLWPTAAEPAMFAPPIQVDEEGGTITLVFDLGAAMQAGVEVELHGGMLVVNGRKRSADEAPPRRVFSFGVAVDPSSVQTSVSETLLTVRLAKAGRRSLVVRSR